MPTEAGQGLEIIEFVECLGPFISAYAPLFPPFIVDKDTMMINYNFVFERSPMTELTNKIADQPCEEEPRDETDLVNIVLRVIWKRRKLIGGIAIVMAIAVAVISLFQTNIYQAKAVIMPVAAKESAGNAGLMALTQQFGGVPGISMPGTASGYEIVGLLKSNILREKIIRQYNLLPILFYRQWDASQQTWKKKDAGPGFILNPLYQVPWLRDFLAPALPNGVHKKDPNIPDTWDALRLLDEIIAIRQDTRQNTITISAEFHDPVMAAKIVDFYLTTLTDYMSSEAKRVAIINRKYLEEQLGSTSDPFIRQKTYNMIAQQIETAMMAGVKENFAFKIIDPPLAPDKKIKPKRTQMVILTLFAALFVGIIAAFFVEYVQKARARN